MTATTAAGRRQRRSRRSRPLLATQRVLAGRADRPDAGRARCSSWCSRSCRCRPGSGTASPGRACAAPRRVLAWLASMPGEGWQDRWLAAGADEALGWVDQLTVGDPRSAKNLRNEVIARPGRPAAVPAGPAQLPSSSRRYKAAKLFDRRADPRQPGACSPRSAPRPASAP